MPVLPGAPNRLDINPSSSVAQYRGGIAENAQGLVGEASARMGADIVQMADRRRSQLDELRVIEASTDLRKQELALTFDEKDGYQAVKGGDVIKRPIVQDYAARYKEATDKVTASLSPRQREMFAGHAASASSNFQANVMRHAMAETEKYGGQVYQAALLSHYDTAGMSYKNAMVTGAQLEGVDKATHHRMDMQGIDGPVREQFVKAARGGLHATVIDKAITAGDTEFANEYFKANRVDMTGDQRNTVERQLKPATDFALGKGIATEAFQRKLQDPQSNAATWMASQTTSPQVLAAAHSLYVQFEHEKRGADAENLGSSLLMLEQKGNSPDAAAAVRSTPAYLNMTTRDKANFEEHARVVQHQALVELRSEDRYQYQKQRQELQEAKEALQEKYNSPESQDIVVGLLENPKALLAVTPAQFAAIGLQVGPAQRKSLERAQARAKKEVETVTIPPAIFNGSVPSSFTAPQKAATKTLAEAKLSDEQQATGKKATDERVAEVIREVAEKAVPEGEHWWNPSAKKLVDVKDPTDRAAYSLLMDNVTGSPDRAWLDGIVKDKGTRDAAIAVMSMAKKRGQPITQEAVDTLVAGMVKSKNTPSVTSPAPPDPLQDPAFKARQARLQKENQEFLAATNKKTEELKAQLKVEEAKLAQMDADLNAKVAGHGAALRKISESQKPELAAHKALDAEIDSKPAKVKEEAIVSAYGTDDKVEVAKAEKAMDKVVEKIERTPLNILTPPSKGGGTILKSAPGSAPRNFIQPVEGAISIIPSVTRGASAVSIASKAGAAVKAAAAGVISFIGDIPRHGRVVIVEHPGKYYTVYGHNDGIDRKEGDQVRQGDQIGSAMGGAMLFEVRHKGVRVDPMKWLKKVGR